MFGAKAKKDAQQTLVESHLIPLLDRAPRKRMKKAHVAAARLYRRHQNLPVLDLKAKRTEINLLLEELGKDSKRSLVMDISNQTEILNEIIASLTDWLNDIWCMAYEHKVQFELVHECLLFVCNSLTRLADVRSGCKCSLNNIYIPVVIKSQSDRIVVNFNVDGASNLESVIQFIWRDTFIAMLATRKQRHKEQVMEMLNEIKASMGWNCLLKILEGGKQGLESEDDEDKYNEEWEDINDDSDSLPPLPWDEEGVSHCRHWSSHMWDYYTLLQDIIEEVLKKHFEMSPSTDLYHTLVRIADEPSRLVEELLGMLDNVATTCSDTCAVALQIYASNNRVDRIVNILQCHSYLLRPRDTSALQAAVAILPPSSHLELATTILHKELVETARAIHQALLLSYSRMDTAANLADLEQLIKLRQGSAARRNFVESWVDSITSPGADAPNPLMFAAMMMGVPPMPGMNTDDDVYTYLDLDPLDPDLEDLRHEFRPALKSRFESWVALAHTMKRGPAVLLTVYKTVGDLMPFLRAVDVTEEMISRLQDRPSKQFVCDGLDAVLAFTKVQRRKWNLAKAEIQKRKDMEAQAANSASSPFVSSGNDTTSSPSGLPGLATSASTSTSSTATTIATPVSAPVSHVSVLSALQPESTSNAASTSGSYPEPIIANPSKTLDPEPILGTAPNVIPNTNPLQNILRNSPLIGLSTQSGITNITNPSTLSVLFGAALENASHVPGPSLDDVD